MRNRLLAWGGAAVILAGVGAWLLVDWSPVPAATSSRGVEKAVLAPAPLAPPREAPATASDPADPMKSAPALAAAEPLGIPPEHAIQPNANPNVAAVVTSALAGTHPERRTALLVPAPFSEMDFNRAPQSYLDVTEPGRVWQTREPAPGVPAIEPVGSAMLDVPELGTVMLRVKVPPLAPANFYSADKGCFANSLTSITVRADADGIAEAAFTATKGTTNTVTLLAACPLTSGQVQFLVEVVPPAGN